MGRRMETQSKYWQNIVYMATWKLKLNAMLGINMQLHPSQLEMYAELLGTMAQRLDKAADLADTYLKEIAKIRRDVVTLRGNNETKEKADQ